MRMRTKRFKPSVARLEERAMLSAVTPLASQVRVVPVIQYKPVQENVPVKGGGIKVITLMVPETIYVGEIAVTTLADDPTTPIRGQTTLRDAITLADAGTNNANQYAITFDVKGTIKLTQPLPDLTGPNLTGNISISGPGVTIQQNADFTPNYWTGLPPVLTVDSGTVASLSGLSFTVRPGLDPTGLGGIIVNDGSLTLTSVSVTHDYAPPASYDGSGCAILNGGTLLVNRSVFAYNSCGSIFTYGPLTVTDSVFSDNNTVVSIQNDCEAWGAMTIIDSTFAYNTDPEGLGGAIENDYPTLTVTGSTFEHNSALAGGAIADYGGLTVRNSVFLDNSAGSGGAIFAYTGDTISSSIFVGNSATEGGAIYVYYWSMTPPPFSANGCIFVHNAGGNIYETYGGAGCFVAGTPVKTEHGLRPIEEIKAGDKVYAYDHVTETWVLANVLQPLTHYDNISDFITIRLWTPIGSDTIKPTGNHPFWVTSGENLEDRPAATDLSLSEQAMTPKGRWIEARDLRIGDTLLRSDNSLATIDDVRSSTERSTVYNLEMETIHSYTVGSASVLVHNAPGK